MSVEFFFRASQKEKLIPGATGANWGRCEATFGHKIDTLRNKKLVPLGRARFAR